MNLTPQTALISNRYLEKGSSLVICGQAGIGKSRLATQFAICCVTGIPFLGWKTNAENLRVWILQNENSEGRQAEETQKMTSILTAEQRTKVQSNIIWHVLRTEEDGILDLNFPGVITGIEKTLNTIKPGIVIADPLISFSSTNLNQDEHMINTIRTLLRVIRTGNPSRACVILHHAGTGRLGAAKAVGFERSGFARNSKALYAITRAQINVAPYNEDDNETLVIASGKCNNSSEFRPFAVSLDPNTCWYENDDHVDLDDWKDRVSDNKKSSPNSKFSLDDILDIMSSTVGMPRSEIKAYAIGAIGNRKKTMSPRKFDDFWSILVESNRIETADLDKNGKPSRNARWFRSA